MKKRLFVVLLLCVSLMLLCGCGNEGDKTEQTGQTDSISPDIVTESDSESIDSTNMSLTARVKACFDSEKTHKPTDEDAGKIKKGMTMPEIVSIIGKPHDFGPTSGTISVVWETVEGNALGVALFLPEDAIEGAGVLDFLQEGFASFDPVIVPACEIWPESQ